MGKGNRRVVESVRPSYPPNPLSRVERGNRKCSLSLFGNGKAERGMFARASSRMERGNIDLLSDSPFPFWKGVRGIGRRHGRAFFLVPLPHSFWGRGQGLGCFRLPPSNASNYQLPSLTLCEQRNPELMRRALELRGRMTPEERVIWQELRGNRSGAHFRRQQVLAPYIVDFYCHAARLVVEIDGSPNRAQQGYDRMRDDYFMRCGIRVLRLSNVSVRKDLASVIVAIRVALRRQNPNP